MKNYMCPRQSKTGYSVNKSLWPDAQQLTVRHLNLALNNTKPNVGQILFHSSLQKSHTIAIRKGMSNHGNYWRNNSLPHPPPLFGYSENLKSVTLAAPVLTWGSPALTRAPAQLIYRNLERVESRRGWFDCGQLWKWLCVLWSHGRPCQIWPPTLYILYVTQLETFRDQV